MRARCAQRRSHTHRRVAQVEGAHEEAHILRTRAAAVSHPTSAAQCAGTHTQQLACDGSTASTSLATQVVQAAGGATVRRHRGHTSARFASPVLALSAATSLRHLPRDAHTGRRTCGLPSLARAASPWATPRPLRGRPTGPPRSSRVSGREHGRRMRRSRTRRHRTSRRRVAPWWRLLLPRRRHNLGLFLGLPHARPRTCAVSLSLCMSRHACR